MVDRTTAAGFLAGKSRYRRQGLFAGGGHGLSGQSLQIALSSSPWYCLPSSADKRGYSKGLTISGLPLAILAVRPCAAAGPNPARFPHGTALPPARVRTFHSRQSDKLPEHCKERDSFGAFNHLIVR